VEPRSGSRLWPAAAVAHLAAVALLLALFRLSGDRWPPLAILFFAPRLLWAAPLLLIAPMLAARGPRRMLWACAAAAALIFGPLMGLHLSLPHRAGRSVRLLTYNVWFGMRDPQAIAEEIAAADPDIVLFQAASHPADVAVQRPPFATYLHDDQFVLASRYPARVVGQGTFINARWHRQWVRYSVDTPLGTLDVFNVHPHSARGLIHGGVRGLFRDDPDGPLPFLERQLAEIGEESRRAGPLLVVAGDFTVPEGGSMLPRYFGGLTDAFAESGVGYGYTFPLVGRLPAPWMRLDRVLLGAGLRSVRAELVGDRGSDHAALSVEIAPR
jgi:endonuclease/exonuclease/phosphatase (EEP) superfamily protein YafD